VEEDVTSQVYGDQASTAEVQAGQDYLDELVKTLSAQGVQVEAAVFYSQDPKAEIVRFARQIRADLVVMGSHGHKGLQDLVYGDTIDGVRHALDVPVLVVRRPA
jgi:manganese transport protein